MYYNYTIVNFIYLKGLVRIIELQESFINS